MTKKLSRKIVAITLAMVMILSSVSMAFATDNKDTYQESAKTLQEYGVMIGDNGDLMLDKQLKRQDAVIISLRFMGLEDSEFENYDMISDFSDIRDDYYKPIIGMSQDLGLVEGMGDGTFGYDQLITAQQLATLLLRSLGYEVPDELYPQALEMAQEAGILNLVSAQNNDQITRDVVAQMMLNTLNANIMDSNERLGERLGYFEIENPVAPVLSDVVASAESTNADSITVTGKIAPAAAVVTVAGVQATVAEDGTFSADVNLVLGENRIEVSASNDKLTDTKEIIVTKVEGLAISAEVVTDSSVKVTFNAPVADTSKIAFELKGTAVVQTTVAWNEAKTEATLTAPSMLLEGAYTVKASGDTFVEGKDSANLVVVKNGPAKIEFTNDKLVKSANHSGDKKVTLRYKVLDKYGVDITKNTFKSDLEVASSKTISSFDVTADKGIMTLTLANELGTNDTAVAVTIIANKTGIAGTATLTVVDAAKIDIITLKDIMFAKTTPETTKILLGKATAAYIPVEAIDQYGNAVVDKAAFDADVLLVLSDSNLGLTSEEYTPEGTTNKALRLVVDTTNIATGKTITVTAVSKLAGKSSTITLEIQESAKADKVSIGSQAEIIAAGDAANTLVIPITVVDQYGVQLTPDEIVSNFNSGKISINGTGALAGNITIATSGENKGKIINDKQLGDTEGTAVITIATGTNVATSTIDVREAAYAYSIKVDNAPAANLLMGANAKMNYKFVDQYGRDIKNPSASAKVTFEVSNADILQATDGSVTTAENAVAVESNAQKLATENQLVITTVGTEGTAKITAKLFKDASVISTVENTISVTSGVPGTLTFEIADMKTIPAVYDGDFDLAAASTSQYAGVLTLTVKDANGNTFAIPADRILSVSSSDDNIIAQKTDGAPAVKAFRNTIVVYGDKDLFTGESADVKTVTATITVVVSTDTGVKEITKTITIAKEAPKAQSVVFAYDPEILGNDPTDAANPFGLTKDAKEITDITGLTSVINAQKIYVYTVDQYGVYSKETVTPATDLKVVNTDRFAGTLGFASDALVFDKYQIKANENVFIMYQKNGAGVYGTFSIKATDGAYDVAAPTAVLPAITGDNNKATALVVTFNEDLYIGGVAVANDQDVAASFTAAGGTLAITSAKYNATNKTITFVLANAADTNTITHNSDATALSDAAGNKYAADVYKYAADGTLWSK